MAQESAYFTLGQGNGTLNVKAIKRGLDVLPGVRSVSINRRAGEVAVDYDSTGAAPAQLQTALEELGYSIQSVTLAQHTGETLSPTNP